MTSTNEDQPNKSLIKETDYTLPVGAVPENIGQTVTVQYRAIGVGEDDEAISDKVEVHAVGVLEAYSLSESKFQVFFRGVNIGTTTDLDLYSVTIEQLHATIKNRLDTYFGPGA